MRTAILPVLALLSACAPSPQTGASDPDVDFEVDPDEAAAGDSVTLELDNESSGAIGYNLCTSTLERQAGGDWQPVPSDRVCTMELRTLAPGEEAHYPMELPEGLDPGEYRYLTNMEVLETSVRTGLRSESFRVRP